MSESSRALNEFVSFLGSPDMYGSMGLAAQMMKWAVHAVVTVLMIAGIIAILFIVLKFAVDVIFLTGVGHVMQSSGGEGGKALTNRMSGFASAHALDGDISGYIKKDLWKAILTLAFIGLIASGMILPLAGQVAGIIGNGVDRLIGLDPATKLANFDIETFKSSQKYSRPADSKAEYDTYLAEVRTYATQIYDLGAKNSSENNVTLNRAKSLYTAALHKADLVKENMITDKVYETLKLPKSYFSQHLSKDICNVKFEDKDVKEAMGNSTIVCI